MFKRLTNIITSPKKRSPLIILTLVFLLAITTYHINPQIKLARANTAEANTTGATNTTSEASTDVSEDNQNDDLIPILISEDNVDIDTIDDSDDTVILQKDEIIDKDYFAYGDKVRISGTINGDLYTAGGQILINGTINGDIIGGGGTIDISGEVSDNIRIAGGQINLSGTAGRNVSIAGGNITILESAEIDGNLVIAGGNVAIHSPIHGDLKVAGGNLILANEVLGDVEAAVGSINMMSSAIVRGDFKYISGEKQLIAEDQVDGEIVQETPQRDVVTPQVDKEEIAGAFAGVFAFFKIIGFFSALIVGLLMVHFVPNFSRKTAMTIKEKPWKSFGVGFIVIIISPIAIIVLMVTLVGLPIAMIYAFAFIIGLYFAKIILIFFIGLFVVDKLKRKWNDGWAFLIGLAIVSLIHLIPFFGWLIVAVLSIAGFGALVITKANLFEELRKKKLL